LSRGFTSLFRVRLALFSGDVVVARTKADRRAAFAERMAEGASVTVLESQASAKAVTEQMKREYVSGWFAAVDGQGFGCGSEEFQRGWADGRKYLSRKRLGLEKYAGPRWEAALAKMKARAAA
jgi:hypothetical protein